MAEYNPSKIIKDGNTYNFRDTTKIPLAGSNEISGSLIPSTDGTVNLGSSTAQWNNAYIKSLTINGVACGDILTHNVSEFVGVTGDQTIDGRKTFIEEVTMFGRDINLMSRTHYGKNSNPSATSWHYLFFRGNTATEGYTDSWYSGFLEQVVNTNGSVRGRWIIRDTSENPVGIELFVNGNDKQVRPSQNDAYDLGTSTFKWKTFNGINPGALSLPSNSYVNVDTTSFMLDGETVNEYTPTADGYLAFYTPNANGTFDIFINNVVSIYIGTHTGSFGFRFSVCKGETISMRFACASFGNFRFFPCQGNV